MESRLNLSIARELERRCQNNPRYSVRAFAKALGVSPATLSLILTGKRKVSKNIASKVLKALDLDAEETSVFAERASSHVSYSVPSQSDQLAVTSISLDEFSLIAHWYHFAILSLTKTKQFRFNQDWIAKRLSIPAAQAKVAMDRLQRLELIAEVDGKWKQVKPPIRIGNNVPTSATKSFQKQLLEKAIESIENDPVKTRDFSSNTLCMHPDLVPYAKEKIRKFRRDLAEELENMRPGTEVYNLTMQIFPVSHSSEGQYSVKKKNDNHSTQKGVSHE